MKDYIVTAIVSTFNAERLLPKCLDDLEAQTIAHRTEIIVVDSGSQQNECGIVADFQRRFDNIVYLRTKRETLYAAWNRALGIARGRYVTNANTDDAHRRDALESLATALDLHPEADLAYANYEWTSKAADTFADSHPHRLVLHPPYHPGDVMLFCVLGCHPMWRRTVFERLGTFDPTFKGPGDYAYLMRFAAAGLRPIRVPETLSLFYQNPRGLTNTASGAEAYRLYKYRARVPIHRLYRVNPRNRKALSLAWLAQGNVVMKAGIPYGEVWPDWDYAVFCYERALEKDPESLGACNNLAGIMLFLGRLKEAASLLGRLPADRRRGLRDGFRSGRLTLVDVEVPAAVEPIDFISAGTRARGRNRVRLFAPVFASGEEGVEAVEFALALAKGRPSAVSHAPGPWNSQGSLAGLPLEDRRELFEMAGLFPAVSGGGAVIAQTPSVLRPADATHLIARITSRTDRLPAEWLAQAQAVDEFWVPSWSVADALIRSGIGKDKVVVVPIAIDRDRFIEDGSLELPNRAAFNFLAIPDWAPWYAWKILLTAYLREFSAADDVCLYLWRPVSDGDAAAVRAAIERRVGRLAAQLKIRRKDRPRIEVLVETARAPQMQRLCAAVDCLVGPSRGDAWGRHQLQAMAMARPVIATAWAGNREFMTARNSYPIRFELVKVEGLGAEADGQRWARPSERHLRELMRHVQRHPGEARRKGAKARADILVSFSREAVGTLIADRLNALERRVRATPTQRPHTERARPISGPTVFEIALPARAPRSRGHRNGRSNRPSPLPADRSAWSNLKPRVSPYVRLETAPDGLIVYDAVSGEIHDLNHTAALLVELCTGRKTWSRIVDLVRLAFKLPSRPDQPLAAALEHLVNQGVLIP